MSSEFLVLVFVCLCVCNLRIHTSTELAPFCAHADGDLHGSVSCWIHAGRTAKIRQRLEHFLFMKKKKSKMY